MPATDLGQHRLPAWSTAQLAESTCCRMFWPKEIWGKHAKDLAAFRQPQNQLEAVACLNEMITDALR